MIKNTLKYFAEGTDQFASRVMNRGYWSLATFPILKANKKKYSPEIFAKEVPFSVSYSVGASLLSEALYKVYNGLYPEKSKPTLQKISQYMKDNPNDTILACGISGLWLSSLTDNKKLNTPKVKGKKSDL